MPDEIQIHCIVSAPFQENTYVVHCPGAADAIVFDPGLEPDLILDQLRQENLSVAAIVCTHGHGDHIGGNAAMKQAFPSAPIVIGAGETRLLTDAHANVSAVFGLPITSPPADQTVKAGDVIQYAGIELEVLDVPGHSPGHVAYLYRGSPSVLFSGDVLFCGSIGRSDFPGSDGAQLQRSIHDVLFALPDDTVVYSGHGPVTTIGQEKMHNPFV